MLQVGDEFRHIFSYSQDEVDTYARISGDMNPLHLDPKAGAESVFGRNIIHGFLAASVFTKIFGTLWYADGHIYVSQTIEWLKPMYVDTSYEATITVTELYKEKHRAKYACTVSEVSTGLVTIRGVAVLLNKKLYVW